MFQKATRMKLRFDSPKGPLTVEDLWDLPLTSATGKANLDEVARGLFRQLRSDDAVSFVEPTQKSNPVAQLKFDIAKHIIDVRVAENKALADARANADRKQTLLGIIAQKENEVLLGSSLDDLKKMAEAL